MRLSERFAYLAIHYETGDRKHRLQIHHSFPDLLTSWLATTQVSPIFRLSLDGSSNPEELPGECSLILIGPVPPWRVREFYGSDLQVWLTLGNYDVIVVAHTDEGQSRVKGWLSKNENIGREIWGHSQGEIVVTEHGRVGGGVLPVGLEAEFTAMAELQNEPALRNCATEYLLLTSSVIHRALVANPGLVPALRAMNSCVCEFFRRAMANGAELKPEMRVEQHRLLFQILINITNTNSALGYISSQALSSHPVGLTIAHPVEHSLLGTGTANLALTHIYRFIHARLGERRLDTRFGNLHLRPRVENDGPGKPLRWPKEPLADSYLSPEQQSELLFPLLLYFSELDHFRTTPTSLSVPVSVLKHANTFAWSLLTLTHEISHRVIRGVLNHILPLTPEQMLSTFEMCQQNTAQNLLEQIKRATIAAIVRIDGFAHGKSKDVDVPSVAALEQILRRHHHEVEEIMVHAFDYLYFYGTDDEKYVSGIWMSWSVLPNLRDRISEYVMRTLCAVLAGHLNDPQPYDATFESVSRYLRRLRDDPRVNSLYIEEASDFLQANWKRSLAHALRVRRPIIEMVRSVLYLESLAHDLISGDLAFAADHGPSEGFPHRPLEFNEFPVGNPLRWLKVFTNDVDSSPAKAAWMLLTLAFNCL